MFANDFDLGGQFRDHAPKVVSLLILVLAFHVSRASQVEAATGDCGGLKYHIALAKSALLEADVYADDDERAQSKVYARIADHELHVALAVGEPALCLTAKEYQAYLAVLFHNNVFIAGSSYALVLSSDTFMQRVLADSRRSTNPEAYDAMKRYAAIVHSFVPNAMKELALTADAAKLARAEDARDMAETKRGRNVAHALTLCRLTAKSTAAQVYVDDIEKQPFFDDVISYDGVVDIDGEGRAIRVTVSNVRSNRRIDPNDIARAWLPILYDPATQYDAVKNSCSTVPGTMRIVHGFAEFN